MAVISHGKNSVYTILKSKFGSNVSTELEKEMSTRLLFNTQKILFEPRFFSVEKILKNLQKNLKDLRVYRRNSTERILFGPSILPPTNSHPNERQD